MLRAFIGLCFGFVGLVVLMGFFAGDSSESSAPHEQTGCSASRRAITGQLKSPGTAQWVDCHSTTAAGVQTVTVTVDSQNSYGALVRSRWVATVRDNTVERIARQN
jgi:hypothetical protein